METEEPTLDELRRDVLGLVDPVFALGVQAETDVLELTERCVQAAHERGLTATALGQMAGMSRREVREILTARVEVKAARLFALARVLGVFSGWPEVPA